MTPLSVAAGREQADGEMVEPMPAHTARNGRHTASATARDYLFVLVIIAGFALYDVWKAWSELGAKSGFGGAGWTLTVIVEVFWLYALWAWLGGAAGPRSRAFARRSAVAVFAMSLVGQASSRLNAHRVPPPTVVVFVSVLPVIVLALIAFLVHYRQLDRADAQAAGRVERETGQRAAEETAAADEHVVLRAQLEAAQAAQEAAERRAADAETERDAAAQRADGLARKLSAKTAQRARSQRAGRAQTGRAGTRATEVPDDVDARAEALSILAGEPGISGAQLGPRVGMSKRWGQDFKRGLATAAPAGPDEQ